MWCCTFDCQLDAASLHYSQSRRITSKTGIVYASLALDCCLLFLLLLKINKNWYFFLSWKAIIPLIISSNRSVEVYRSILIIGSWLDRSSIRFTFLFFFSGSVLVTTDFSTPTIPSHPGKIFTITLFPIVSYIFVTVTALGTPPIPDVYSFVESREQVFFG